MKKTVFTLMAICLVFNALAQTDSSKNYFKSQIIPPFNLIKIPDSSSFANNKLQKNKATVLIFFAPDCPHCHDETKKLTAKMDQLKNVQILMVTWMDFSMTKKFYSDNKLADYPNITITTDPPQYKLIQYYGVHSIPDVFVYDKNGKYLNHFKMTVPVDEIAKLFSAD